MSRNPFYNRLINSYRWQLLRAEKLSLNPVCEICASRDITRPAEEVHHRVPVESGVTEERMEQLAYDLDNLQSLCRDCHKAVHMSGTLCAGRTTAAAEISSFAKIFIPTKIRRQ